MISEQANSDFQRICEERFSHFGRWRRGQSRFLECLVTHPSGAPPGDKHLGVDRLDCL
jgi:hypothetical protein